MVCTASIRIFAPRYHRVRVLVCFSFYSFLFILKQGNPRVKGGKALGCIYKGLWTLGVEKGSAVQWREELDSRTDKTYLRRVSIQICMIENVWEIFCYICIPCECIYQKPYHHFFFKTSYPPKKLIKIQKYHVTWM